jgi:hypothetical protein
MTLPQDGTLSVNTAEGYTEYDPVKKEVIHCFLATEAV